MTSERRTAAVVAGAGVPAFELSPHNCFACGSLNREGLGLVLHVEPARSWTEVSLDARFEGWDGIAHGGIVSTILDEVMAWALVGNGEWGVTARLSIDFHKPVPIGTPFRAEGWVASTRRRIVETEARLVDHSGTVLATATGTYLAAGPDRRRQLQRRYGFRRLEEEREGAAVDNIDGAPGTASRTASGRRVGTGIPR